MDVYSNDSIRGISITSEKNVTIDFIVAEADQIWKESRSYKLQFGDGAAIDRMMATLQKLHPEFCQSYPIVYRYICQMQEYSSKVFKLWLLKIQQNPWKTEEEYLTAQTDYIVKLYRFKNPRTTKKHIDNLRFNIQHTLENEHEKFKHYANKCNKELDEEESAMVEKNASELHDFVVLAGPSGIARAETIRIQSDISNGGIGPEIASAETVEQIGLRAADLLI